MTPLERTQSRDGSWQEIGRHCRSTDLNGLVPDHNDLRRSSALCPLSTHCGRSCASLSQIPEMAEPREMSDTDEIRTLVYKRINALNRRDATSANAALDRHVVAFEVAGP